MKKADHGKITYILALTVFAVFAVSVVLVLLTGAKIYRELNIRSNDGFEKRTAARYITTRIHQASNISLEEFDGIEALALRETMQGEDYVTWVYYYDGYIRELMSVEGAKAAPEYGEKILKAEELSFSWEDGLLRVRIVCADGTGQALLLYVQKGKAVGS